MLLIRSHQESTMGRCLSASRTSLGVHQEVTEPCVWLESRWSGVEPSLVLGTVSTLLMFGCKGWVGVAPTLFFVWLEGRNMEWIAVLTPLMGPTCHRV
jgi:hypothetical protein